MRGLIPFRRGMLEPISMMPREMADLLSRLFGEMPEEEPDEMIRPLVEWAPRVDVEQTEKALLVKVDLPGVDPKDVVVSVEDGMLIIKGEKKEEKTIEEKNLRRKERFIGRFFRSLPLPKGVEVDKITARSSHGVLTLEAPILSAALPKRIDVQVAPEPSVPPPVPPATT